MVSAEVPPRICPKLPTEVWSLCWCHCHSPDLRRLVSVSRTFRAVCQPLLFQHKRYNVRDADLVDRSNWTSTLRDLHLSTLRLEEFAASVHASSVRSWQFGGSSEYASIAWSCPGVVNIHLVEEAYAKIVGIFTSTLGLHQNLRVLHLSSLTVRDPMREALLQLARLEDLRLTSCRLLDWKQTLLSLQKFTLENLIIDCDFPEDAPPLHMVSPEPLRALAVTGHDGCTLIFSSFAIDSNNFDSLVSLSVALWDAFLPKLLAFLKLCPRLSHLEISQSTLTRAPRKSLALSSIPSGVVSKAPRLLALFFRSSRSIESMELSRGSGIQHRSTRREDDVLGDLAQLAQACPGVRTLSLPMTFPECPKLCAAVKTHWPALRELTLSLRRAKVSADGSDYSDSDSESDDDLDLEAAAGNEDASDESDASSGSWGREGLADARLPDFWMLAGDGDGSSDHESEDNVDGDAAECGIHTCVFPDVLAPGHLYAAPGLVPPPQSARLTLLTSTSAADVPTSLPTLMAALPASLPLPPNLESLRPLSSSLSTFVSGRPALSLPDQHRAVLTLERVLPSLRGIEFPQSRFLSHQIWHFDDGT
ncbi:hypothetical protein DFH06DRAFT_1196187, partial [Mycena polygramma]